MDDKKKSKPADAPEAAPITEPTFTLTRLRSDSAKLFGVTTSTFDGATRGLKGGEYTLSAVRRTIENWQNKPIKKEVN